jgi:hypothetical protein
MTVKPESPKPEDLEEAMTMKKFSRLMTVLCFAGAGLLLFPAIAQRSLCIPWLIVLFVGLCFYLISRFAE